MRKSTFKAGKKLRTIHIDQLAKILSQRTELHKKLTKEAIEELIKVIIDELDKSHIICLNGLMSLSLKPYSRARFDISEGKAMQFTGRSLLVTRHKNLVDICQVVKSEINQ